MARRTMILAGAAVVVAALIGGGATYLATSASAGTAAPEAMAAGPHAGHGKARSGRADRAGRAGAAGLLGQVEHGEFTTASAGVLAVQRGAITAIDTGSVTLRSADGYTASYTITPTTKLAPAWGARRAGQGGRAGAGGPVSGGAAGGGAAGGGAAGGGAEAGAAPSATDLSGLKTGDTVQVMATKTDSGLTATRIAPAHA